MTIPSPERMGSASKVPSCRNGGEGAAGDCADAAASVLDDLRLPVGIQPRRSADDEASGLQCMLPNVDLRPLGKQLAEDGARIHRRMDLLAIGHHGVARQRVVVLLARQLTDAANRVGHLALLSYGRCPSPRVAKVFAPISRRIWRCCYIQDENPAGACRSYGLFFDRSRRDLDGVLHMAHARKVI